MKKTVAWLILPLLLVATAACGSAASKSGASSAAPAHAASGKAAASTGHGVTVGWMDGLTGFLAFDGLNFEKATQMAVKQINAHGGVLGHPLKVIYNNTGTDPAKARQVAERLILSDHVAAILGDYFSPNTIAILPLLDKYKVPAIALESQADSITHSGHKYIFRTIASSSAATRALVDYVIGTLHYKTFVSIGGTDAYSQSNMNDFKKIVASKGGKILGTESYDPASTKDFVPYLLKYAHSKFNAFFLGGSPAQSALIIKQARASGLHEPFISTTGTNHELIWKTAGRAAIGTLTATDTPVMAANGAKYSTPAAKRFDKEWVAAVGPNRLPYDAAHAYDATMLLAKAINKAGSTSGPKIRQAILSVGRNYPGAAGTFTIEPNGGAQIPQFIMRWGSDGKLHIVAAVPNSEVYGGS